MYFVTLHWLRMIGRSFRVGSIVLALHDVSDVFMEAAKLCKYSGNEVGASINFGLFVLSWVLLRLIYFPFWIIWSTRFDSNRSHFYRRRTYNFWKHDYLISSLTSFPRLCYLIYFSDGISNLSRDTELINCSQISYWLLQRILSKWFFFCLELNTSAITGKR